jgi:NAD(P)-dependent dehydrogenase (short-subunit alcohol dehydrogenase family)
MPEVAGVALSSIAQPSTAVVVGATGGIGGALLNALAEARTFRTVFALSRHPERTWPAACTPIGVDILNEASLAAAAATVAEHGPVGLVLVATGQLHGPGLSPEKTYRALSLEALSRAFAVNAAGPALVAKHFLPLLPRQGKAVFAAISARVGSIGDNRLGGWHAYRASKAALNMLLRNLAIELAVKAPEAVCVGLHPGTVDTRLSQPFQAGVPRDRLFTPALAAERLLGVVDRLTAADTGGCFAWDGARIPP